MPRPQRSSAHAPATHTGALVQAGAQIPLVQIYSASRPVHNTRSRHLPLRSLSQIAQTVRRVSGLKAEVF